MISILSRREVGGDLSVSAPALSSAQIRIDAAMSQLSDSQTENFSGVVALVLGGGVGRALGSGVFAWASRRGSAILAESLYQGVSLGSEVLAYRSFTQGLSSLSDTKGLATDFLSFGVLRGVGRLAQGQNIFLAHTLQAGGMVGAHHLAYGMGLATAPQGTTFEQFLEAERMNVLQIASLSLLHTVSGGRFQSRERAQGMELEVLRNSSQPLLNSNVSQGFAEEGMNPQQHVMWSEAVKWVRTGRRGVEAQIYFTGTNPSSGSLFQNSIAALSRPRDFSPYGTVEEMEIAHEGALQLVGRLSGRYLAPEGVRYTLNYYLNGDYVGYLTHQVIPETKTLRLIDMKISPQMQGKNLGKVVMLYHLYQAHLAGWQFTRDLITNQKLIQTANRPFEEGLNMYLPDARVQKLMMTMDPWEPEIIPEGEPLPLYTTDTMAWQTNNYTAYRITGTPNPDLFRRLER